MPEITYIRDGHAVLGFRYRDVLVTRIDSDGAKYWQCTVKRYGGAGIFDAFSNTKNEAIAYIDEMLDYAGRNHKGQSVGYVVDDEGDLVDVRLLDRS